MPEKTDDPVERTLASAGDPKSKADLESYVHGLKRWNTMGKHEADNEQRTGKPRVTAAGGFKRIEQDYSLTRTPKDLITFDPNVDTLWPGSIVQGKLAVETGHLQSVGISPHERGNLSVTINSLAGKTDVPDVAQPDYKRTLDAVRATLPEIDDRGASSIYFDCVTGDSSEQVALSIGASAKYMGFSGSLNIKGSHEETKNTVVFYLRQIRFTAVAAGVDLPNELVNEHFTNERLATLHKYENIGPDNPPVAVNSVIYGRILMFSMTARASVTELEASLKASYSGFANVEASVEAKYKKTIQESSIKVLSRGGSSEQIQNFLVGAGGLKEYLTQTLKLSECVVIGYTLRALTGETAAMSESTNYTRIRWTQGHDGLKPVKVIATRDGVRVRVSALTMFGKEAAGEANGTLVNPGTKMLEPRDDGSVDLTGERVLIETISHDGIIKTYEGVVAAGRLEDIYGNEQRELVIYDKDGLKVTVLLQVS